MPITRKLVAQNQEENQVLKMDSISRYIVNSGNEWQLLFGPNSALTNSVQIIKLAAELDTSDFNSIRVIGYLYNTYNGTIDNASSCTFKIYKVATTLNPVWDDQLLYTSTGTLQSNSYFFKDIDFSSLLGTSLDGDTTLMIEGTIVRSGISYRDRLYVNHLGVYDSIVRLRQDVEFLDLTKVDE